MTTPFISLCMPVYNSAPYLRECLDSIRTQSFPSWELVCTDDGSTDDSGNILDGYARLDSRIKVIHQQNGGHCVARNAAIDRAKGEWLWVVDSDDVLLVGALEAFWKLANKTPYDGFCLTGFVPFQGHCHAAVSGSRELVASTTEPTIGKSLYFQTTPLRGFPFNRIVRRTLYSQVPFIDGLKYLEDSIQLIEMLSFKARWAFVDIQLYGYRHREDSICHGYRKGKCALEMASFELMFRTARKGLELSEREFADFVELERDAMQYYLIQGFAREELDGLKEIVAAYEKLCRLIGTGHVSCFYEWRMCAVKYGVYRVVARPIRIIEYLYCGIKSRFFHARCFTKDGRTKVCG